MTSYRLWTFVRFVVFGNDYLCYCAFGGGSLFGKTNRVEHSVAHQSGLLYAWLLCSRNFNDVSQHTLPFRLAGGADQPIVAVVTVATPNDDGAEFVVTKIQLDIVVVGVDDDRGLEIAQVVLL